MYVFIRTLYEEVCITVMVASLGVDTEEFAANDFKMNDIFSIYLFYLFPVLFTTYTASPFSSTVRGKYSADNLTKASQPFIYTLLLISNWPVYFNVSSKASSMGRAS